MNFPRITPIIRKIGVQTPQDIVEAERIIKFESAVRKEANNIFLPNVVAGNTLIFPISQKHSIFSNMPYGKTGTVKTAGCGPLAVEYALRTMGFNVSFEEILSECSNKGYRAYIYDENENIIDGSGTEYRLFDNLAEELKDLHEILIALKDGKVVTLLINNTIYHQDKNRKGNHFITLVGIDKAENAMLMDGNLITDNSAQAFVKKDFKQIIYGIRLAWSWSKKKIERYI